tara:strand:- start:1773 stop:2756 length:984 start_codon:yes stop_codon:yes gene_type:complete
MKKGEISSVNKVLFSIKGVKCCMQSFCSRKHIFGIILLQFFICLSLVGCVSIRQNQIDTKNSAASLHSKGSIKRHTVRKGDTLYSISQIYNIDYKDLAKWNNLADPSSIDIGQQLIISPPSLMKKPSVFPLPDPEPSSVVRSIPEDTAVTLLKMEPKSLKLAYSEQAISQVKELESVLPSIVEGSRKKESTEISGITPDNVGIKWIWPTEGRVSSHFTESTKGMDISGKTGQPILASAAGRVVYSGTGLRGYGQLIIIKHNNTYLSAYAHNSKLLVKEGQKVARGQIIAEMGKTDSKLVRLHFEIRKNGKPVDPLKHLPEKSSDTLL